MHEAVACVLTPLSGAETRRWRAILAREQRASALHPADAGDQVEYNIKSNMTKIKSNITIPFSSPTASVASRLVKPVLQPSAASKKVRQAG